MQEFGTNITHKRYKIIKLEINYLSYLVNKSLCWNIIRFDRKNQ
jgi:hypothetical protein